MKYTRLEDTPASFYEEIGLMSGLEVHQQLQTSRKLFCRCPAGKYSDTWDAEILRHMRPTLSELGEYDGTALMEFKTKKEIVYRLNKDTVCTYEFDDTPPFEIDDEAVETSIELCMVSNCGLVSELHVARKQYLDGSIPAGFQRTLILGVGGWVPYKGRKIGIRQISLEEDSCREISDVGHLRIYRTDRLGMPITELVTEPEMHTPEDVAGVCEVLRQLARSTGRYRTGPGTGRQDVNVSVRGGERNEIKGVCGVSKIPLLVHNEAFRQVGLLEIKAELANRGVTDETLEVVSAPLEKVLANTGFGPMRYGMARGERVAGVVVRKVAGLIGHPLGARRRFYHELSDRVRVIACLDVMPNVLTPEAREETLSLDEWMEVKDVLGVSPEDAVLVVWGNDDDLATAVQEIELRMRDAIVGVPLETRQPMPDGTTRFERILPGPERMYPDTDLPPKPVTDETIARLEARRRPRPWERVEEFVEAGLDDELAERLATSRFGDLFEAIRSRADVAPRDLALFLLGRFRNFERLGLPVEDTDPKTMAEIFSLVAEDFIVPEAVTFMVERHLQNRSATAKELVELMRLQPATEEEISDVVNSVREGAEKETFRSPEDRELELMGRVMDELRGRVQGSEILKRLRV